MILFEFLKIIGYVLLILILLVLTLVILLLFLPVLYRYNLNSDNGFIVTGKLKILFGLVSADISSEEDKLVIRVLGIHLKSINTESESANDYDNEKLREEEILFNMSVNLESSDSNINDNPSDITGMSDDSLWDKIKSKLLSFLNKTVESVKRIINSIISIVKKTEKIIEFITDENVIAAFTDHKSRVYKIITHIVPKSSDMHMSFGLDDPAAVGYILAIISPYYGLYGNWLTIDPHFDETIFKLNGNVKGRVYLFYLIWHFVRVYFDKNVKAIRKKYKTSV